MHSDSVSSLTIYTLPNCSTCRQAVKWLDSQGIEYREKLIRDTPPSLPELRTMLTAQEGELKRLFNTSGLEYRSLKLAGKLPMMAKEQALQLLAGNGSLVKRPFLIGPEVALVGFDANTWKASLTL